VNTPGAPPSGIFSTPEEQAVARALVQTRYQADEEKLAMAVDAFTAALRGEGERIERVITRLKDVMARATREVESSCDTMQLHSLANQRAIAVRYCIEHYFQAQPTPVSPSDRE
jgi:hypothetical protein